MYTRAISTLIIRVGNSQEIFLPKKLLQQYHLAGEVGLRLMAEGSLITPIVRPGPQDWEVQMQAVLAAGQEPEGEILEGFADTDFEETEWQW